MLYELIAGLYKFLFNFGYWLSTDISNSIKVALSRNDPAGLDYIIETKLLTIESTKALKQASKELLSICYYRHNFLFAEKLINVGAEFKSSYITYAIRFPDTYVLKEHIKVIEPNIAEKELLKASTIINAMSASSLFLTKLNGSCIDYVQTWLSITYTDNKNHSNNFREIYKDFVNHGNFVIKSLVHSVSIANYPQPKIKILAPIFNDGYAAFHHYMLDLIYVPFFTFSLLERSRLAHEVGHYVVYNRFVNKCFPFEKNNITQKQDYDSAATKTLCKIGELIDFKCHDQIITKGFHSHEVAYDLLHDSIITLFYYKTILQDVEASIAQKNQVLKTINARFNFSATLINKHGNEKVIKIFIEKIIQKFNLTQNSIILLERIGEYVNRNDEDDYTSELIVRLPELIARGLDNDILSSLDPLKAFWIANIGNLDATIIFDCNKEYIQSENTTIVEIIGDSTREEL